MLARLRAAARRVRANIRPRPLILCYHRVAELAADPWAMAVAPANFASQIATLKANRPILSVEDYVRSWVERTLPPGAIALSFDDAYQDVLASARPILERYSVPATLFIPTGLIDEPYFWWDELVTLIALSRPEVPVALTYGDLTIDIPVGDLPWQDQWRAWQTPASPREKSVVEARSALKPLDHQSRSAILRRWRRELGDAAPACAGRPMTSDEVKTLLESWLFAAAAHTVSHLPLTEIDSGHALLELRQSRQQCEALAGRQVGGVAYPFGQHDRSIDALAAEAGFRWGLGLEEPMTTERSPFAVPRFYVPDVDGPTLLRQIAA